MGSVKVEEITMQDSTDVCEVVTITVDDRVITYTICYGKIIKYEEVCSSIDKQ